MPNSDHLVQLSDDYLRDANSDHLSPWGRLDAVFESGYCALLSRVPADVWEEREHPLLGLLDGPALAYASLKYCGDSSLWPSYDELLGWTLEQRQAAGLG